MRSISRRDANAFARAVRRLGLASRVMEMCVEAGGGLAAAAAAAAASDGRTDSSRMAGELSGVTISHAQMLSLFHTLMDGCRRAVDMAGEDPKVWNSAAVRQSYLKVWNPSSYNVKPWPKTTIHPHSLIHRLQSWIQDAILDFFGAAVKAQDVLQHHAYMRHLERLMAPFLLGGDMASGGMASGMD